MKEDFVVKDSGKRQGFETGAVRDTQDDKPRPDLISPFMKWRLGMHLAKGAKKYSERNWEKGFPFSRLLASAERHLTEFEMGLTDEDHLAACIFNLMAIMHFQEVGRDELDDLPKYKGGE